MINSIFQKKEYSQIFWSKFILLLLLSLVIIFINSHHDNFIRTKPWLLTLTVPFQWLADSPKQIKFFVEKHFTARTNLLNENRQLKDDYLLLQYRLQQITQLSTENEKLKTLLHASKELPGVVKIGSVTGISPDPQIKEITINRGLKDGVFIGQPVLDASGIIGQIINTSYFSARVLLLTDSNSRIPVEVSRTGYQTIAAGNYIDNLLILLNIPDTTDIKVGDLLVSSGLGGRFPANYPVAKVTMIDRLPAHGFLNIQAEPLAKTAYSRLLLLLFPAMNKKASSDHETGS
ncbi:MAG: rod shape-determining protein MreC [Endozoicomonadaceae bacterium]|nr:rod shape-determining protein MreC [Endozoicomonadaceae bacterium]